MANKSPSAEASPSLSAADLEKVFSKFDANGDGKISPSELGSLLTALVPDTSTEDISAMMEEMDSEGDGFVDLNEFAEFHARSAGFGVEEESKRELKEAFDVYDADKNGLISPVELQDVMHKLGEKCSLEDCSTMITSVDVDGDGHVNFEEFAKMMTAA